MGITEMRAIITGASSGIGRELAHCFAKDGYALGLIARRESHLTTLQSELMNRYRHSVHILSVDVSKESDCQSSIQALIELLGGIDCLVINAGISIPSPAYAPNSASLTSTIQTNLLGAGYCAYAAIPTMIRQGYGHIVAISSLASYRGLPEAGAYCASKSGVNALFESMRLDLAPKNIQVSTVRPGFIRSAITDKNHFYMPQLMSTKRGASVIYSAIKKRRAICSFPRPLSWLVQLLSVWPVWLYDAIFSGRHVNSSTHHYT